MWLVDTAVFLAAAVVAVPISQRLGLGTVLGYLAAGVIIGPSGFGLIGGVEGVLHFAEFGVVLLLFLIGLELQPKRLWMLRREVFGFGGAQVLASTAALGGLGVLLGLPAAAAGVVAFAFSLSSTAFVLQLLGERNEQATAHGRASFGILLFQDLAAIPALAIVPLLGAADAGDAAPTAPLVRFVLVVAILVGIILAGRYLLRPVFRIVAQTRSHELSSAWALLVVIATALAMQAVGLSMALGAFIAGVLLADSEYRHEAEANVEPFKGLLLGLFFIAVGMSADLDVVRHQPLLVFAVAVIVVAIKIAVVAALAPLFGLRGASGRSLALALSQAGEFGFVIFGIAERARILPPDSAPLLVSAVTLSMAATPALLMLNDVLRRRRRIEAPPFDEIAATDGAVIIAGYGRFGQIVARVCTMTRISTTALEIDPGEVEVIRRFGHAIYYGDAARVDLLRAAGAERARLFVLAIDDPDASLRTAQVVRENFPHLRIIARARNREHAYALMALGIDEVIRETYLSSLAAATRVLEEVGLSTTQARDAVRMFRQHDEELLRRQFEVRDDEARLIELSKSFTAELEQLFQEDREATR
jgi:monovalent cation:proton antiporter-2 (CPA2) family protein